MILDSLELPSTWRRSPVSAHFRRVSRKGFDDKPLLSVYREHGVVPRGFTDDNWNLMPTDLTAYQLVEPGDLAVNKMKAWQGSLGLSQLEGVVSPAYFIYTPVSRSFDQRYLNYLIRSRLLAAEFARLSDGVRPQQWDLDPKAFERVPLPEPPMKEQRRIADYLDCETATIDALIAKQVELMNRLRERRQAVIDRAFVSTSEIVILRRHLVLNDSGAWGEDPTGADDVAVLRSTEQTVDGYWAISDPALRTLSQTERQNTRLREGDLIVTKTSGSFKHVGKTTLVDNEVAEGGYGFGNFMQRLRLKSTMIPKFLWWFMRTDQARSWINLVATTSTGLMNLNGSTLGRMEVPLPSLVALHD